MAVSSTSPPITVSIRLFSPSGFNEKAVIEKTARKPDARPAIRTRKRMGLSHPGMPIPVSRAMVRAPGVEPGNQRV